MKKSSFPRFLSPVVFALALPLALNTGCILYLDIVGDSEALLAEPQNLPPAPNLSQAFGAYRDVPVMVDPEPFAETVRATDMGNAGVPLCVGLYPLRAIAERGLRSLVERHFRPPAPGEQPALVLETTPSALSVRKDGGMARVSMSVTVRCNKVDEARTVLLAKTYTGTRTGAWADNMVPVAVYEALNDIWLAFLEDFLLHVPPASLADRPERKTRTPVLGNMTFSTEPLPNGAARIVGVCSVSCNGREATESAEWAHQKILSLCAGHLGVDEARTGVRYDDGRTRYDEALDTWTFVFSTWARTRMSLQYDSALLKCIKIKLPKIKR